MSTTDRTSEEALAHAMADAGYADPDPIDQWRLPDAEAVVARLNHRGYVIALASQPEPAVTEALRRLLDAAEAMLGVLVYEGGKRRSDDLFVPEREAINNARRALAAVPAPSPAPAAEPLPTKCPLCGGPHLAAVSHSYEELRDYEQRIEERKRAAARVEACRAHDRNGPTDEASGFPTCSECGAILTAAPAAEPSRFEDIAPAGTAISDVGGEQQLVAALTDAMLQKLAKNRGKRHWRDAQPGYLSERLEQEFEELGEAVSAFLNGQATPEDVWLEAADVANFTAMLASNVAGLREARAASPSPAVAPLDVERLARAIETAWDSDVHQPLHSVDQGRGYFQLRPAPGLAGRIAAAYAEASEQEGEDA